MLKKIQSIIINFFSKIEGFYYIFFSIIATIILVVLLFQWGTSYYLFQNSSYDTFYYFAKNTSTRVMMRTETLIKDVRNTAIQISIDKNICPLWNLDKPTEIDSIIESLQMHTNYLSYVNGIYIYNEHSNLIYSANTPSFSTDLKDIDDFNIVNMLNEKPIDKNYHVKFGVNAKSYSNMAYVAFYPYNMSKNAVIIRADFKEFEKAFDEFRLFAGSYFWIIDESGKSFYGNDEFSQPNSAKIIKTMLSDKKEKYHFINYKNKKSMFDFSYSELLDRYFIFAVPKDEINNSYFLQGKSYIVIILVFSILIGFLLLFIWAKFSYKKYNNLTSKLKMLNVSYKNTLGVNRESFLNILLYSSENIAIDEFYDEDKKLSFEEPIYLALLSIDNYKELCAENESPSDIALYKYGIINIICELLDENFVSEGLSLENSLMIFFIEADVDNDSVIKVFCNAREKIKKHLDINFTLTLSNKTELKEISSKFAVLNNILQYRYIYGEGSNLDMDILDVHSDNMSDEISKDIQELGNLLTAGDVENAKELYSDLMKNISTLTVNKIQIYITMMVNIFYDVFCSLEKNFGITNTFNSRVIIEMILSSQTLNEVKSIFDDTLEQIFSRLQTDANDKYIIICDNATKLIENEFSNPLMGLEYVADALDISPNYLSKIFRTVNHMTLPNFILKCRVEMAKTLIDTTNMNIAEIALATGFSSSSYFGVVFRKHFGISPGIYRDRKRGIELR